MADDFIHSAKWKTFLIKDQINWFVYEEEEKADKKCL